MGCRGIRPNGSHDIKTSSSNIAAVACGLSGHGERVEDQCRCHKRLSIDASRSEAKDCQDHKEK